MLLNDGNKGLDILARTEDACHEPAVLAELAAVTKEDEDLVPADDVPGHDHVWTVGVDRRPFLKQLVRVLVRVDDDDWLPEEHDGHEIPCIISTYVQRFISAASDKVREEGTYPIARPTSQMPSIGSPAGCRKRSQ